MDGWVVRWGGVVVAFAAVACTSTSPPPEPGREPDAEAVTPAKPLASDPEQWTDRDRRGRGPRSKEEWVEPTRGDPLFRCTHDHDCTTVEMDCCNDCNGGWELAVNVHEVARAKAKYSARDCAERGCTKKGCAESSPRCQDGECVRRIEDWNEPAPDMLRNRVPPE